MEVHVISLVSTWGAIIYKYLEKNLKNVPFYILCWNIVWQLPILLQIFVLSSANAFFFNCFVTFKFSFGTC